MIRKICEFGEDLLIRRGSVAFRCYYNETLSVVRKDQFRFSASGYEAAQGLEERSLHHNRANFRVNGAGHKAGEEKSLLLAEVPVVAYGKGSKEVDASRV